MFLFNFATQQKTAPVTLKIETSSQQEEHPDSQGPEQNNHPKPIIEISPLCGNIHAGIREQGPFEFDNELTLLTQIQQRNATRQHFFCEMCQSEIVVSSNEKPTKNVKGPIFTLHGTFCSEKCRECEESILSHVKEISTRMIMPMFSVEEEEWIQLRYSSTAPQTIQNLFFDEESFVHQQAAPAYAAAYGDLEKYRHFQQSQPLLVEIPSDQYDEGLELFKRRTQPNFDLDQQHQNPRMLKRKYKAENVLVKSIFSYRQLRAIAKYCSHLLNFISYDTETGDVFITLPRSFSFGTSATILYVLAIWNGQSTEQALAEMAKFTYAQVIQRGAKNLAGFISKQMNKMGANSIFSKVTYFVAKKVIVERATETLATHTPQYIAAALRNNVFTGAIIAGAMAGIETIYLALGKQSTGQTVKNVAVGATSAGIGTAGGIVGSFIGTAMLPGVGTIVGGLVGGIASGLMSTFMLKSGLDYVIADDQVRMKEIMDRIMQQLSEEFLLSVSEFESSAKAFQAKHPSLEKLLQRMFESKQPMEFAMQAWKPILIQSLCELRSEKARNMIIVCPSMQQLAWEMTQLLLSEMVVQAYHPLQAHMWLMAHMCAHNNGEDQQLLTFYSARNMFKDVTIYFQ